MALHMKRPAVFFDRDNTLLVGNDYLGDPAKVRLVPGAADAVARARRLGYATVVVSNQSGVAKGMFDEAAVHAVNQRLEQLLLADDPAAVIDRHEFCPFHPDASVEQYRQDSDLRKPKPGMILQAAEMLALDVRRSWMIGDAPRDVEAGAAAGCRTILFADPALDPSPAAQEPATIPPDFTVRTLAEALDVIESNPEPPLRVSIQERVPPRIKPETPAKSAAPPTENAASGAPNRPRAVAPANPAGATSTSRTEALLEQILAELRREDTADDADFSVSKLLAGIVQVLALGVIFLAYLNRDESDKFYALLLFSLFLQMLVIALLIMGRQR